MTPLLKSGGAAALALGLLHAGARVAGPTWTRPNHRGREVTLLAGPSLVVAAAATIGQPASVLAGLGTLALGCYDDLAGGADPAKGFRGHLGALRQGRVTTGAVKVVGIGAVGLGAARLGAAPAAAAPLGGPGGEPAPLAAAGRGAATLAPVPRAADAAGRGAATLAPVPRAAAAVRRPAGLRPALLDQLLDAGLVAGSANLLNLLDLRPGRALKVAAVAAVALGLPGPAGAAVALLPGDLRERTMLGDGGANGFGALLGLAAAQRLGARSRRTAALVLLAGVTAASEVVSFSRVIDATPPLRALDRLGRLP